MTFSFSVYIEEMNNLIICITPQCTTYMRPANVWKRRNVSEYLGFLTELIMYVCIFRHIIVK